MRSIGKWFAVGFFVLTTGLFSIWVTSPDPQYNPASFEDVPLEMSLAPLEEAVTLAQFHDKEGQTRTMIVLDMKDGAVTGIDLEKLVATGHWITQQLGRTTGAKVGLAMGCESV